MSQINIRNLSNENDDGSPEIVGVSTFSATSFFVPPKGTTAERPSDCEPGSIRFNTDTANLEYFRGNTLGWSQFELVTSNLGGGTGSNTGLGVRGFAYGGHEGPNGSDTYTTEIDFLTISTLGDATKFGDLTEKRGNGIAGFASRTRGIGAGGYAGGGQNIIEFITMSQEGNAIDFGDLTSNREGPMGLSSETRGIAAAGWSRPNSANIREIDYLTIAETGNSIDFGDLITPTNYGAGTASSTRGILLGGYSNPSPQENYYTNSIEFITIATTGNAQDFGDLISPTNYGCGTSSTTRGLLIGGYTAPNPQESYYTNRIEFITIATLGDGTDFGDINSTNTNQMTAGSNSTRGLIWGGGADQANRTNVIDFVTIASTGNATDFGDMTIAAQSGTATSSPTRCTYYSGNRGETNVIQFVEIMTTGNAVDFGDAATGSHGKYSHCGFSNGHGGL